MKAKCLSDASAATDDDNYSSKSSKSSAKTPKVTKKKQTVKEKLPDCSKTSDVNKVTCYFDTP